MDQLSKYFISQRCFVSLSLSLTFSCHITMCWSEVRFYKASWSTASVLCEGLSWISLMLCNSSIPLWHKQTASCSSAITALCLFSMLTASVSCLEPDQETSWAGYTQAGSLTINVTIYFYKHTVKQRDGFASKLQTRLITRLLTPANVSWQPALALACCWTSW